MTPRLSRSKPADEPKDEQLAVKGPAHIRIEHDVDSRTPAGNLKSRSNIVADGPGTIADHI